jgi:hypothetical protein
MGLTIEGYRYETECAGIGSSCDDSVVIHIPTRNLILHDEGIAYWTQHAPISKKAEALAKHHLHHDRYCLADDEKRTLIKQADEEARVKVLLPLEVVDELCALLAPRSKDTMIDEAIVCLVKKLFSR